MSIDLATVWAGLIAFSVLAYVVLDGFDLGIGILFPLFADPDDRNLMTNAVAPVWDGNETWLVLGGGALMAIFPAAYAVVLPALYVPLILMLLGLVFRGVAFEFRFRTVRWRGLWNWGFAVGSTVAGLMQGISLGALIQGIRTGPKGYAGGWWDWLSPFSILTGIALLTGYALLGACWLNLKTSGDLQQRAQRLALYAGAGLLVLIGVVSLATPFVNPVYFRRWFAWPTGIFSVIVPVLVLLAAFELWHGVTRGGHLKPFLASLALFILSYAGLGISVYPYIVPGALTIEAAAAPASSMLFLLAGAAILIPIILIYTGFAYWIFRGKIDPSEGYH